MVALESKYALIDNVNIHYITAEQDVDDSIAKETLIFLHGFPECWETWKAQLNFFSAEYNVIAPDLPGYNLSDKPEDVTFYSVPNLIAFITKFIKTVSTTEKVTLIAHDWGGAIAWPLVAFNKQIIDRLVILNAAHPSTFTREMINNAEQRKRSEYIHDLIGKDAEELLSTNNYQYLKTKVLDNTKTSCFNQESLKNYQKVWQQPGAINGMLQYYRAMPQLASSDNNKRDKTNGPITELTKMKIPNIRIEVPTLVLWGEQDQAFVNENLNDIKQYAPNSTVKRFENVSHWIMHEIPDEVNKEINNFLVSSAH